MPMCASSHGLGAPCSHLECYCCFAARSCPSSVTRRRGALARSLWRSDIHALGALLGALDWWHSQCSTSTLWIDPSRSIASKIPNSAPSTSSLSTTKSACVRERSIQCGKSIIGTRRTVPVCIQPSGVPPPMSSARSLSSMSSEPWSAPTAAATAVRLRLPHGALCRCWRRSPTTRARVSQLRLEAHEHAVVEFIVAHEGRTVVSGGKGAQVARAACRRQRRFGKRVAAAKRVHAALDVWRDARHRLEGDDLPRLRASLGHEELV
mmetsp:Transcript_11524/g.35583  ORF Transcript_11524/g.35583 Transcript_11524/m.35583 type:complete len:265 (+) Transcript_11524:508-1302(+)